MEELKGGEGVVRTGASQVAPAAPQASSTGSSPNVADDLFATDEFRMYAFKILPCARRTSHDWTTCPFAHPGEKARRRDPRLFSYLAVPCPDVKQNQPCPRGDSCQYCHSVFEYWLHPSRYRTQLCQNGANCRRTVCFFAHSVADLRTDPSHLNLTCKSADGAAVPGEGAERLGGLERSQSDAIAVLSAAAAAGKAAGGGSPGSPGQLQGHHARARAEQQAVAAEARQRRESAPMRLMGGPTSPTGGAGAGSPGGAPLPAGASAYDFYMATGTLSGASRSLSLPLTPQLGRSASLGGAGGAANAGGTSAYGCAGPAAAAARAAAAAAAWMNAAAAAAGLPGPSDDGSAGGGDAWWGGSGPPAGAAAYASSALLGAPRGSGSGGPPALTPGVSSVYAQLLGDRPLQGGGGSGGGGLVGGAFPDERSLIEDHAAAVAALQAATAAAAAAAGGFSQDAANGAAAAAAAHAAAAAAGCDPLYCELAAAAAADQMQQMAASQQQHELEARIARARSGNSDAASVAAAAALGLVASSSLDSSYSSNPSPWSPPLAAMRGIPMPMPGVSYPGFLGCDGAAGGAFGLGSPLHSMHSVASGDLLRSGSLASQREGSAHGGPQQALGGGAGGIGMMSLEPIPAGAAPVPAAAVGSPVLPPPLRPPALAGSPPSAADGAPLPASPLLAGRGGGGGGGGLGMLSPMAAPTRDTVVVPGAPLGGAPGQPSLLEQHLADAGLSASSGAAGAPAPAPAGGEADGGGGGPAGSDAMLRGLVDALVARLQQQPQRQQC